MYKLNITPSLYYTGSQRVFTPLSYNNEDIQGLLTKNKQLKELNKELKEKLRMIKEENDLLLQENSKLTLSSNTSQVSLSRQANSSLSPEFSQKDIREDTKQLHENSPTEDSSQLNNTRLPTEEEMIGADRGWDGIKGAACFITSLPPSFNNEEVRSLVSTDKEYTELTEVMRREIQRRESASKEIEIEDEVLIETQLSV